MAFFWNGLCYTQLMTHREKDTIAKERPCRSHRGAVYLLSLAASSATLHFGPRASFLLRIDYIYLLFSEPEFRKQNGCLRAPGNDYEGLSRVGGC